MKVCVLSSCYGGYDDPFEWPEQSVEHVKVLVTDEFHQARPQWVQMVEPRPHLHPRMAAKVAKCRPDLYAPDCDVVVWVDASIEPTDEHFLQWMLDNSSGPMSQFAHPSRDCFYDEAVFSAPMEKYQHQTNIAQAEYYRAEGMPLHWGLWATGVIVYRPDIEITPHDEGEEGRLIRSWGWVATFGDEWLIEQTRWTYQDQISHPYLAFRRGAPWTLPGDLFYPPHFVIRGHVSHQ